MGVRGRHLSYWLCALSHESNSKFERETLNMKYWSKLKWRFRKSNVVKLYYMNFKSVLYLLPRFNLHWTANCFFQITKFMGITTCKRQITNTKSNFFKLETMPTLLVLKNKITTSLSKSFVIIKCWFAFAHSHHITRNCKERFYQYNHHGWKNKNYYLVVIRQLLIR